MTSRPRIGFAEVYRTYFSFVWRSIRRLGTPVDQVDDCIQEVFIAAHRGLPEFEGRSSLKTWLFGIIVNVVRAHRRTLRGQLQLAPPEMTAHAAESLGGTSEAPDDAAIRAEVAAIVDGLLDHISDEKRDVFVLAELEEMSAPEISVALAIPLNTVYSRLRLARKAFGDAVARYRAREEGKLR